MKNCHIFYFRGTFMLTFFYEDGSVEVFSRNFMKEIMNPHISSSTLKRMIVKDFQVLLCERKVVVLVEDNCSNTMQEIAGMMNEIVHRA